MGFISNFLKTKSAEIVQKNREQRGSSHPDHQKKSAQKPSQKTGRTEDTHAAEKSPEKNGNAAHQTANKQDENLDRQIVLDIALLLPQVPKQYLRPNLPADLKKELRFSVRELLPSLAQGKATVPFSRIAGLSPEIFSEHRPDEPLEITLPMQQVIEQVGEFPTRPDQVREKTPVLGEKFSSLIAQKNSVPHPATEPAPVEAVEMSDPVPAAEKKPESEPTPAPQVDEEKISLRLSALLPQIPKALLRQDSPTPAKSARIALPFHIIEPQLASGKVDLSVGDFFHALTDDLKTHFVPVTDVDSKIKIPVPLMEVLLNLPGVSQNLHTQESTHSSQTTAAVNPAPPAESAEPELQKVEVAEVPEAPEKPAEIFTAPAAAEVVVETPYDEELAPAAETPQAKPEVAEFVFESKPEAAPTVAFANIQPPQPQYRPLAPPPVVATHAAPPPVEPVAEVHPTAAPAPENPFFSNEKIDPVKVTAHAMKFDGVTAAAMHVAGETATAGDVPPPLVAHAVCTAALTLFQSVHGGEAAGKTRHLTLQHDTFACTFFKHDEILLGVMHPHNPLPWETHGRLASLTQEIARLR